MKKSEVLFHASARKNIKVIKPENITVRDPKEGKVVFATPSKAYASTFIVPAGDDRTIRGRFKKDGISRFFIVINSRKKYEAEDKGGAIYELSSNSFTYKPEKAMGQMEWVSKKKVKPLAKKDYASGLETMKKLGVKICFVSQKDFNEINQLLAENPGKAEKLIFNCK